MLTRHARPRLANPCLALLILLVASLVPRPAACQERPRYLLGENQGLEMIVHITGEVKKPGEYRVSDRTDVLELFSKAGGATPFSRLRDVTVRHPNGAGPVESLGGESDSSGAEIVHVNLERLMRERTAMPLMLEPGDVVSVPKSGRQGWLDASRVVRDLSIIASAYFVYKRATR